MQVNIAIPPANQQSNVVRVTGPAANVKGGVKALLERVEELDKEQEVRVGEIVLFLFLYHPVIPST